MKHDNTHRISHHFPRRHRHRWEKRVGSGLLNTARFCLVLCVFVLPFLWGGRHALAVGLTGLCLLAVFLFWVTGSLFRGTLNLQPAKGSLLFLILLGVASLQLSPEFSQMVMETNLADYWQIVLGTGVVNKEPVLAVIADIHWEYMLILCSAGMAYLLFAQLFSDTGQRLVLLSMTIAITSGLCGLASLIQHFGGHDWLFWVYKAADYSVSGPYFNKNHFAQLEAMGLFTALGLFLSMWDTRRGSTMYKLTEKTWRKPLLVTLGAIVVICATSLTLSLSRAGILCTVGGLGVFFIYLICVRFGKKITLPVFLLLVAVLLVSFYGIERIIFRLEMVLSGEDFSSLTRWEMWMTMLDVIALSPWWGTGFGSVRSLAPLFDLSYLPGFVTFDAHNDYIELVVTFGFPLAALLLTIAATALVRSIVRLARRDTLHSSLHPLAVGILLAILVAAAHECFDYGLKQSANLLVFLALVVILGGLFRTMGDADKGGTWHLGRALYLVPLLLLGPVLWLGTQYANRTLAGMELVRLQVLRDVAEIKSAFTPETRMMSILRQSDNVLNRTSENLEALEARGMAHSSLAWIYQTKSLAEQVGNIIDRPVSENQIWRPQYSSYLEKAFWALSDESRLYVSQEYGRAAEAYACMANANPMSGLVYSALAQSRDNETAWKVERGTALLFHNVAYKLYPSHIAVLRKTLDGYWRAWQEEKDSNRSDALAGRMLDMAHSFSSQKPEGMKAVYPILWQIRPDALLLQKMTSDTIQGQEALANYLEKISCWPEALAALDRMEQLNSQRLEQETPDTMGNQGFLRRERRNRIMLERIILERKIRIMETTGQHEQALALRERVADLLYAEYTPRIERAEALISQGEYLLAEEVLKAMPEDGRALVRQAEILFNAGRYEQLGRILGNLVGKTERLDDVSMTRLDVLLQKCTERGITVPDYDQKTSVSHPCANGLN